MASAAFIKRWLRRLSVLLLVLLVFLVLLAMALQTAPAKRTLAALVSTYVSEHTPFSLRLEEVAGILPCTMRIERLELADEQGRLVTLHGLELRLAASSLIRGRVHVTSLMVNHIEVWRRPPPKERFRVPRLPGVNYWPSVDSLHVERITLDKAVAGVPAALTIKGWLKSGRTLSLPRSAPRAFPFLFPEMEFEVRGLDAAGIHGAIRYGYEDDVPQLHVSVEDHQLLPSLLGVAPPVSVRVEGQGTRADWRASLTADTGDAAVAEGVLRLREGEIVSLETDMLVHVGVLPLFREYADMLGASVSLRAAAALDRQGTLRVDPVLISSDVLALSVNGEANVVQKTVDFKAAVTHDDVSRFPGMALRDAKTPLQVDATLRGEFTAAELVLASSLGGEEMLDGTVHLGVGDTLAARGSLRLTPPVWLCEAMPVLPRDGADMTFDVSYSESVGTLEVSGIELASMGARVSLRGKATSGMSALDMTMILEADDVSQLNELLPVPMQGGIHAELNGTGHWEDWFASAPTNIRVNIKAATDALQITGVTPLNVALTCDLDAPTLQVMHIGAFSLTDGNLTVDGEGTLNLDSMTCDAQVNAVVAQVAALPVHVKGLPAGELRMQTRLQGGISPLSLGATLAGQMRPEEGMLAMAGDAIAFDVDTTVAENHIEINALSMVGAGFNAEGKGIFNWSDGALQSELHAAVPDLLVIGEALKHPLSGAVTVAATGSGQLPNLKLTAQIVGNGLTYGAGPPVHARFEIVADDVPARFEATITGQADGGGETLALDLHAALVDNAIRVSPLTVASGKNRITGQAVWPLDTGLPEVQLDAVLADVGALGTLVGLDIQGRAEAQLQLQADTGRIIATARDIGYSGVSIEKMESQLTVETLRDKPTGSLLLELHNLKTGTANMNRITGSAQGNLGDIQWSTTLDGTLAGGGGASHALTGKGSGSASITDQRIEVVHFEGALGDFPLVLDSAASAAVTGTEFQLTPLALRMGEGSMRVEGQQATGVLRGELRFESFPLDMSGLFMAPAVTGMLDGTVTLAGTSNAPEIEAHLSVSEARLAVEAAADLAPLEATLTARLAGGRLEGTLAARIEEVATFDATGSIPVVLQLRPWAMEVPPTVPVSGNASWEVSFSPVLTALGMVEHYLDAPLTGTFAFSGTMGALTASGDAYIRDGRYENARAGTRLERIRAHLHADGPVIRIVEGTAATGSRGEIVATGELRLQPGLVSSSDSTGTTPNMIAVRLELKDAELAQLDYLNGRVNGVLMVEGGLAGALISGDLTIGPVYASMPDRMPVSEPTVINVIEVVDGEMVAPPERERKPFLPAVALDIRCDMPRRVFVRAPILDSEWGGDVRIKGLLTEPKVEGRISVLRGHLDFLSRRFQLRDSAINFTGGAPTAPWLDMHATTETPSLSARLNLTGEMSDVKLELSSEPPLPQDEVLSQVLFGRDLSRISPVQAIQLARVAAMFNRGLAGRQLFSGNIMLPGIDRIDIRTGERADETVVGMGKYFTDSVYVEVEQGTTSDSGKISVEVEVTPQVSVKGDVDAKERSGVGVFWRKDY